MNGMRKKILELITMLICRFRMEWNGDRPIPLPLFVHPERGSDKRHYADGKMNK